MEQPGGSFGKHKCVLSIDGGGVRGLIPSQVLEYLEQCLQDLDGPEARIADYFDVIAGTSTGGLIALMLASPNEEKRPMFDAKSITKFYLDNAKSIFERKWYNDVPLLGFICSAIQGFMGPKYSSHNIERLLQSYLKETKLSETLTRILIPAFDTKLCQPRFFTTAEAQLSECRDAPLWRVGRGTSAAPTYLPAIYFSSTPETEYHLTDGGLCANNPTFLAMVEAFKDPESNKVVKGPDSSLVQRLDDCLVLSLGCGTQAFSYDAREVSKWGKLGWVNHKDGAPIINMLMDASADMMDNNIAMLFRLGLNERNFVRIQTTSLDSKTASVDDSSDKNLHALIRLGNELLEEKLERMNYATGECKLVGDCITNRAAIARFAQWLSLERRARQGGN